MVIQIIFLIVGFCIALDILLEVSNGNALKLYYSPIRAWRYLMIYRAVRREKYMSRRYSGNMVTALPEEDKELVVKITKKNIHYLEKHPELSEPYNAIYSLLLDLGRKRLKDLKIDA